MDVLAHPSYREGLPRAVVQGLLSAKPAIAYDLDGAPEVCIPNKTGVLVQPGDIEGLRAAALLLRDNPTLRRTLGEAGRAQCKHAFAAQTMVDALEDVYAEVLD
jgi:glycosyltransferase involved in cell wall biosynthesis